jgi:hypothetical protein
MESLRSKHKHDLELKSDEIANLTRLLSDATDKAERCRVDLDSKTTELSKLHEQLRTFKEDTSSKYETYSR